MTGFETEFESEEEESQLSEQMKPEKPTEALTEKDIKESEETIFGNETDFITEISSELETEEPAEEEIVSKKANSRHLFHVFDGMDAPKMIGLLLLLAIIFVLLCLMKHQQRVMTQTKVPFSNKDDEATIEPNKLHKRR